MRVCVCACVCVYVQCVDRVLLVHVSCTRCTISFYLRVFLPLSTYPPTSNSGQLPWVRRHESGEEGGTEDTEFKTIRLLRNARVCAFVFDSLDLAKNMTRFQFTKLIMACF